MMDLDRDGELSLLSGEIERSLMFVFTESGRAEDSVMARRRAGASSRPAWAPASKSRGLAKLCRGVVIVDAMLQRSLSCSTL